MNRNEVLSYHEMCTRERLSLQRGMNYRAGKVYSIILMSQRPNAPYEDSISEDGKVLIYEGHDVPKGKLCKEPKKFDQPEFLPSGNLTENGKFNKAVLDNKLGLRKPEIVRVYEKIVMGFGRTTDALNWSTHGSSLMVSAKCSSLSCKPLKMPKTKPRSSRTNCFTHASFRLM